MVEQTQILNNIQDNICHSIKSINMQTNEVPWKQTKMSSSYITLLVSKLPLEMSRKKECFPWSNHHARTAIKSHQEFFQRIHFVKIPRNASMFFTCSSSSKMEIIVRLYSLSSEEICEIQYAIPMELNTLSLLAKTKGVNH